MAAGPQGAVWQRINCKIESAYVKPLTDNADVRAHAISASPGEYEVKVLHNRRLSRSIKFTVGPDGQIVSSGVGAGIGMPWVNFVPVRILDDQDGPWDINAWKTDALYGNPLKGFNVP